MIVYQILDDVGSGYITNDPTMLQFDLESEPEFGETIVYTVKIFHMTTEEYKALPEFQGF